jgi:hypothetical protein
MSTRRAPRLPPEPGGSASRQESKGSGRGRLPLRARRTWPLRTAAVTCLTLLVGVALFVQREGSKGTLAASGNGLPPVAFETGVVHVHGLGVDPGNGVLYAATHSGLFRLPEKGRAVRIANRDQDTMGFAVVGPGTFIGSGHPDFREDDVKPPLLGLLESTDSGEHWARLSLHGRADFHALRIAQGRVYGYDSTSQTLMVSTNRIDWDRRANLLMNDFVVSPTKPDVIVASVERGLARSTNGGRTFVRIASPPDLVVLAWTAGDSLYGLADDGSVQHSADGGQTWTTRGNIGAVPEALAVDVRYGREVVYAAAVGRGILASKDGGNSFTTRYQDQTRP